jgi:hypothetical protein
MADCNVRADTDLITADSTEVTADGLYTGCEEVGCTATADSTAITADSTVVTADGFDPACEEEEPVNLGLSDPDWNQLRREDEMILRVIEEFVRRAA